MRLLLIRECNTRQIVLYLMLTSAQPATKKQEMPKSAVPWLKPVESGQIPGLSRRSSRYDKVAM